jgi:2-oxoglutarate dehydrogenase E1 component
MIADGRYMEMLWHRYRAEPTAVPSDWRNAFDFIQQVYGDPYSVAASALSADTGRKDDFKEYLARFGHLHAHLDPLEITAPEPLPARFDPDDERARFGHIAVEMGHLDSLEISDWIEGRLSTLEDSEESLDDRVYQELIETEIFDQFLAAKHPGKKRFGSEGADAILPLLHALRREAAAQGIDEIVMGSMHRGRLSILANFCDFSLETILGLLSGDHPFPDRPDIPADVPYHLGHKSYRDGVHCTLLPNPSHLEAVNPLIVGYARARRTSGSGRAMAIIVHTDASVIGQGVNAELLQMSQLAGFQVGGTVHIVINNQIGFTTEPSEARSSRYCTGPWKAIDSLVAHVNGDDVDAVVRTGALAMAFRERFHHDAVIDLICYRANGHNEVDEPRFTQPLYYNVADSKEAVATQYERRMVEAGKLTAEAAASRRMAVRTRLDTAFAAKGVARPEPIAPREKTIRAACSEQDLRDVVGILSTVPDGSGNAKMIRLMERRLRELDEGISWPLAETMAFAFVLRSGQSVRLCGQDVERGSFSQRHLAAIDPDTGTRRHILRRLVGNAATWEVINSPLSEYAVLGFEYGYSIAAPETLCIWEAQFGDFLNGAQILIDQFIASGFEKWKQTSNITILLPHGLEGQGPEHSSARIERLLQLCARDNISVAHPSTPANYFHLLLNQATQSEKPLFIITPKVLLRLAQARSPLADFTDGSGFVPVLLGGVPGSKRVILCSGKIAYELEAARTENNVHMAILRLEIIYPFPAEALLKEMRASGASEMIWLQEEPENFGAGCWLAPKLSMLASQAGMTLLPMVARPECASPAGSFHGEHDRDQQSLVRKALRLDISDA